MITRLRARQSFKAATCFFVVFGLLILSISILSNKASAAQDVDLSVTLEPSLQVTIPSSSVVLNLAPENGNSVFASNDLTVTVATNNPTGYSLSVSSDSTNLTNTTADAEGTYATIPTLDTLAGGYDESTFTVNRWGYKLTGNNYFPFETNIALNSNTDPTNGDTTTMTFGAKVDMTQDAGLYELALNFVAVSNVVPAPAMQNFTLDQCQALASDANVTVTDSRDGSDYTVRYINGNCWMTENLRLSGGRTLTSADSNVASSWSFPNNSLSSSGTNYIGNTYTTAGYAIDSTYGGYYNYCAASAGTVCSESMQDATYDICPKGWRLPTNSEQSGITSYSSAFSPVYSGYYSSGSLHDTGFVGYWWSSTANRSSNYQYNLYYLSGSLGTAGGYIKYYGSSVRCIRSTAGTLTINFDGNGSTGGSTASQQIEAGTSTNLNANGFTRTNYAFTGWNTAADGSGTAYADIASFNAPLTSDDTTVTLYAQWEFTIATTMQGFTLSQCQQVASDGDYTLTDERDGNNYTVRYINGNCWMTQNLRLSGGRTLTSADSNVASSWSFPSTSLTSGNSYTDARSTISSNTSYGGYYNFCAASAGTVCDDTTKQDATYDICPKGWRLPTQSEFAGIVSYASAFSPVYSGLYSNGSLSNIGSRGYWWSSTADNSYYQYRLYYVSGSLDTYGDGKDYGFSVRCVRSS